MTRRALGRCVVLCLVLGLPAVVVLCWAVGALRSGSKEGQLRQSPPSAEENLAMMRRGQPIVAAIYQFKEDTGVWPQRLADLVPDYLEKEPELWHYSWAQHGNWSLTCFAGYPFTAVSFWLDRKTPGRWVVTSGYHYQRQANAPVAPQPWPADPETQHQRFVREMRRRIAREPDEINHRRKLVDVLTQRGELKGARRECYECGRLFSAHWWPVLALDDRFINP